MTAPPLSITTASLPNGQIGAAYTAQVAATGGVPPYTWSASGLPGGLAASAAGAITGTPTASGSFTVGVTVTDSTKATAATQNFSLSIAALAPAITSLVPPYATAGGVGFTLTVNGSNFVSGSQIVFGGTALATTFMNSASLTAPVPAALVSKAGALGVTVLNPGGVASAAAPFTAYSKLTILTTALPAVQSGAPYNFSLVATGGLPPYTWSVTGLPAGLSFNSATGVIGGTWTVAGNYNLSITVTDNSGQTASTAYTETVTTSQVALAITTASPLLPATVGTIYGVSFSATGGTAPYTFTLAGTPPPGLLYRPGGFGWHPDHRRPVQLYHLGSGFRRRHGVEEFRAGGRAGAADGHRVGQQFDRGIHPQRELRGHRRRAALHFRRIGIATPRDHLREDRRFGRNRNRRGRLYLYRYGDR